MAYDTSPKYIAFQNSGQDREHNIYTEEFFGGADTYIYINDKLYKDISAIQYSVREQKKPIYGYASRLYDDVANGVRIVQGLIKVPVRNTSFMESLTFSPASRTVDVENISVPNWVYQYDGNSQNNNSNEENISSHIYNIQNKLKSKGYKVNATGILDAKTKIAILKYKKNTGQNLNLKNINSIFENEV